MQFSNLIIVFTPFKSSICLKESGPHAPYQMTSDPPKQEPVAGLCPHREWIHALCFTEPQALAGLILTLIPLFGKRGRRAGKWGPSCPPKFPLQPRFGFWPRPVSDNPTLRPELPSPSATPTCSRFRPGPRAKPPTVPSQLLPFSCCLSGGPLSFFT